MINTFRRERIKGIQQFLDVERNPHIYIFTNKRVVEIDYLTGKDKKLIATLKELKEAKK